MAGGGNGHNNFDVDLNLAPVVDCMIVLISFLLLGASFASIILLDTKVPSVILQARQASKEQKDIFKLELMIQDKNLGLSLYKNKQSTNKWSVPRINHSGKYDLEKLHKILVDIKAKHPARFSIDFNLAGNISYGEVVEIMDHTRNLNRSDPEINLKDPKTGQNVRLKLLFPDVSWTGLSR